MNFHFINAGGHGGLDSAKIPSVFPPKASLAHVYTAAQKHAAQRSPN